MVIIGIAGGIGHGKTTLAEDLLSLEPQAAHLEMSALITEVINDWQSNTGVFPNPNDLAAINGWLARLQPIIAEILHQDITQRQLSIKAADIRAQPELYEKLFFYLDQVGKNPRLGKTRITTANKSDYRAILQWLGGYVQVRLPPGAWFRALIRRAAAAEFEGGTLCILSGVRFPADVDVIHDAGGFVVRIERKLENEIDKNDLTEKSRDSLMVDTILFNDAGLAELQACALQVYADISSGQLRKNYYAKEFRK